MKVIETSSAPSAIGPYSQAVLCGNLLFMSGQIPLKPDGELITGDIMAETRQCFSNLNAIVHAAGSSLEQVVKLTIYTTDLSSFAKIGEVCQEFLQKPYPARETVEVSGLPKGARVEISAVVSLV